MDKIRTKLQLQEAMANEFAWRRKELHGLKVLLLANEKTPKKDLCIRASITLLYAHWEGFVKQISLYYLEFVARKKLKHNELSSNFLAMAIGKLVRNAASSSKLQPCLDVADFFRTQLESVVYQSNGGNS